MRAFPWGESSDGSCLATGGGYPQDRGAVSAGDDHAIRVPARSAQAAGKVRDVLGRSALNVHLLEFRADGEDHPTAIVGPGRGKLTSFRTGQRAYIDTIERAYIVACNAIFANGGEHHPAAIGRHRHRRLVDEGHFIGRSDFETHGLRGSRLSPRSPKDQSRSGDGDHSRSHYGPQPLSTRRPLDSLVNPGAAADARRSAGGTRDINQLERRLEIVR